VRWPWQRERTEPRTAEATREPVEPAAAGRQVPPAGWAFLPPLQRTIGSVQLTSDPGRFAGALASWGDPSFTGPMAHLISADAPPGVIDVDGGGPVPGHVGYSAASAEMTLLPPPPPRAHAKPASSGGLPATAQRSVSDGFAPGGSSLLAAEPDTFPVLHVDALPLQGPGSFPEPEVAAPSQSFPEPGSFPEPDGSAPTTGADASRPSQSGQQIGPSEPSVPSRADGSTSDGHATYVPLPSAPAVQRASSGTTGSSPAVPHAPHAPRLGLGMPLSFSEPPAPAGPQAAWSAGRTSFPVQRSAPSASPSAPVPVPAVDDGGDHPRATGAPEAGAGTANEAAARQTASSAQPSGPPDPAPVQALDAGMGGPVEGPAAGPDEPEPSPPPDDATAPLLSAAASAGSPDGGRDGNAGNAGDVRPGLEGSESSAPNMPVVSRFGPAASEPSAVEELGSAAAQDSLTAQPASAGSTAEIPGRTLASPPDTGPANETPAAEPALGAPLVFGPAPGRGSTPAGAAVQRAAGAAGKLPVQRGVMTGTPPVQRDAGINASAETASSAEGLVQAHGRSVRDPQGGPGDGGPGDRGKLDGGPIDGGKLDGGKPEAGASSGPPATLRIQRAARPTREPLAREIPSPLGPVVLRVVQTASAGITPDTWQLLTAMPPATGGPALEPAPLRTRTPEPGAREGLTEVFPISTAAGPPAPEDSGPAASGTAAAGSDGGLGFDDGFERMFEYGAASSDPGTGAGFGDGPDASPEASAAVGRVIQRTLSVAGTGSAESPVHRPPAGAMYRTEMLAGARTAAAQSDGPRAASLQRLSTPPATGPGRAGGPAPAPADRSGVLANAALPAFPAGPGFHAGFGPGSETPPPAVLSLAAPPERAKADDVLQRDLAFSAFDSSAAARGASGLGAGMSEASDAAPSSPADAGTNPAGPGQQGPEATGRGGAGTQAGAAGTATPEQLEDLAKRLAGPLIRRIKAEMLLDRERRGLRTDAN
jgi:hypothetical protein